MMPTPETMKDPQKLQQLMDAYEELERQAIADELEFQKQNKISSKENE